MKKIIIAGLLLSACVVSAQEVKPKYEIENNLVKATYYHDNGNISQEGYFKDGKPHGKWTSFKEDGSKLGMGEYKDGVKCGKWFFWGDSQLSEVDYSNSRIAEIKTWSNTALVSK